METRIYDIINNENKNYSQFQIEAEPSIQRPSEASLFYYL